LCVVVLAQVGLRRLRDVSYGEGRPAHGYRWGRGCAGAAGFSGGLAATGSWAR
jgi:hypothetical protein